MSAPALTSFPSTLPLTRASVLAAHALISPHIHRTPVLTSRTLSALASTPDTPITLLFKAENLQKIGAFKIRGATHALSRLTDAQLRNGVVTHSSGNHAQALALAARTASATRGFPIPAHIVMPHTSTPSKIAATRSHGAEIHLCGAGSAAREAAAAALQARTGAAYIPPYDHGDVILGQGTVAVELLEQAAALGHPLDAIVVPCGGGGLLSGVAVACAGTGVRVYGAEPRDADDAARGLREGRRVVSVASATVADGLRTPLGVLNWGVVSEPALVGGVFTAGEREILRAVRVVAERMKVLVEPSGAVPVAVVVGGDEAWWGEVEKWRREERAGGRERGGFNVGVVLSGGNTTIERLAELFAEHQVS